MNIYSQQQKGQATRATETQPTIRRGTVFSAERIARLIAVEPEAIILPTPEQAEIIEQPLGSSVLVIAGAGSGKTETMANRVVWLVANGLVTPSQVLGLTFTRKAAGELGIRITQRLQQFSARLAAPEVRAVLTPAETKRAAELQQFIDEGLELPEVSTYNAFASAVVQEFGPLAGIVGGGVVIDQATAWGIARNVVCESDDEDLATCDDSIAQIVERVTRIDHAVSDNLTTFDAVLEHTTQFEASLNLPYNEKRQHGQYADIAQLASNMQSTRLAVRLAVQFSQEKRRRGLIEFSDQLALAVETLNRSPEAVRVLRQRTPVVLLDEVQDTSVAQTRLLSTLFAGSSVMAVGDPHQSIYGFRGASASNLRSFHNDFRGEATSSPASTLTLSVSWRNPEIVLSAANAVSLSLAERLTEQAPSLTVRPLISREEYLAKSRKPTGNDDEAAEARQPATQTAANPALQTLVTETIDEEFDGLAAWMRNARIEHHDEHAEWPTAAVVMRSRAHMPRVSAALWRAGVPNRIVGIGGLLKTPEVTDLVCLLRCIWFADASNELVRLLAGPKFRLGAADIRGLSESARWFSKRDHAKQPIDADTLRQHETLPDPDRQFTLLDALDEIASMKNLDHVALRNVSDTGKLRLHEAARLVQDLRRQVGGDVLTLLRSAAQALNLDIELDAAEHTNYDGSAAARANLDAFAEQVEGFLSHDDEATLASTLAWLERAAEYDEAAEHVPEPEPGTVQLITAHGAKGLEWHLVAVPRLVDEEFPSRSREGAGWLRAGQLPDELRGDAAALPRLDIELAETQRELLDKVAVYKEQLRLRHEDEERRLAYVAFTRAKSRLLLTCSFWGGQTRARQPAVYLRELHTEGLIEELPVGSEHETDPSERQTRTLVWPADPLGARADAVMRAAGTVLAATATATASATATAVADTRLSADTPQQSAGTHAAHRQLTGASDVLDRVYQSDSANSLVGLLLAEREAAKSDAVDAGPVAERITASTFHEFIEDPRASERRRLRPMPTRPYRRTRTGNLFHEWVERRASTARGTALELSGLKAEPETELSDEQLALQGNGEPELQEQLQQLIERFEESRWADLQPIAVEMELTMPFAGSTLVCKLDAVYRHESTGRYEVVDWKSGKAPRDDEERATRFLQLDLYRHAFAAWSGADLDNIDVTLFYVAEGAELRGKHHRSLNELEMLWAEAQHSLAG